MALERTFRSLRPRATSLGFLAAALTLTSCSSPETSQAHLGEQDSTSTYLAEAAQEWATYYGLTDPPDVDVVRFVLPEEQQAAQDSCLETRGFQVDGPGTLTYPPEQEDAATLAQFTCRMEYPVKPEYAAPWQDEQIRIQYAWTRDFVIPCLTEHGHQITGLPSEDVFVRSWTTDPFLPFAQVTIEATSDEFNAEWNELEEACPQMAPSSVIWDSMTIDEWRSRSHQ